MQSTGKTSHAGSYPQENAGQFAQEGVLDPRLRSPVSQWLPVNDFARGASEFIQYLYSILPSFLLLSFSNSSVTASWNTGCL